MEENLEYSSQFDENNSYYIGGRKVEK